MIARNSPDRIFVEEEIDCDREKLYGSLDQAITYLQEVRSKHPTATLDEHWIGYEDMYMRFVYSRLETDAEYASRQAVIEAEKKAREDKKRREAEAAKIAQEIAALQSRAARL